MARDREKGGETACLGAPHFASGRCVRQASQARNKMIRAGKAMAGIAASLIFSFEAKPKCICGERSMHLASRVLERNSAMQYLATG